MKILTLILRVLLGLFLLMPVGGVFGLFPEPTADMYPSEEGWMYMSALMDTGFMMPTIGILSLVCAVLFLANKTTLGALVLAPFTVNVMLFHWFLDPSPISQYSVMAYVLLVLNAYFLWINREKYKSLW